ncbi:MAG: SH3 domain-containing protein, partial [Dehalococcoidia bacterium]
LQVPRFRIVIGGVLFMQAKSSTGRQRGKGPRRFLTPEMYTHWDRGLAIMAGMVGVVLLFFLLLIALPITNSESSEPITGTGTAGETAQSTTAPAQQATGRATATVAPAAGPDEPRLSASTRQFPYVRRGPGTNFTVIMNLQQGQQVDVIARSVDRQWFQIVLPNNARERGWVSQEFLTVEGDVNTLPEVRE